MRWPGSLGWCLAAALLLLTPQTSAQSLRLPWWTVDGGGGASVGGDFELPATAGQADAGLMAAGAFTLVGGFWGGMGERGCDADGDGDCDAVDLVWVVRCADDPAGCGCPGNPDRNLDGVVDGWDTGVVLAVIFW